MIISGQEIDKDKGREKGKDKDNYKGKAGNPTPLEIDKEIESISLAELEEEWEACLIEMNFHQGHLDLQHIEHTSNQTKGEVHLLDSKLLFNLTESKKSKKGRKDKMKCHLKRLKSLNFPDRAMKMIYN